MSDKKDKGYDASMLRFVGNLLSGDPEQSWKQGLKRYAAVDAAIQTALVARDKLKQIQKNEEESK